jgi:hypothetical protein
MSARTHHSRTATDVLPGRSSSDQSSPMWISATIFPLSGRSSHNIFVSAADPGATMTFVAGGALKPIGGHILSHSSATRMFLRKGENGNGMRVRLDAAIGAVPRSKADTSYLRSARHGDE